MNNETETKLEQAEERLADLETELAAVDFELVDCADEDRSDLLAARLGMVNERDALAAAAAILSERLVDEVRRAGDVRIAQAEAEHAATMKVAYEARRQADEALIQRRVWYGTRGRSATGRSQAGSESREAAEVEVAATKVRAAEADTGARFARATLESVRAEVARTIATAERRGARHIEASRRAGGLR